MNTELGYLQKKHHVAEGNSTPRFVSRITKKTYAMVLAGGVVVVFINSLSGVPSRLFHSVESSASLILCCPIA